MAYLGEERRKCPTSCQTGVLDELAMLKVQTALIDQRLKDMNERREIMHQENKESLADIRHFFYGNGKPGAEVRFDRLEQRDKLLMWVIGTTGTCVIGLIVNQVVEVFAR